MGPASRWKLAAASVRTGSTVWREQGEVSRAETQQQPSLEACELGECPTWKPSQAVIVVPPKHQVLQQQQP